MKAGVLGYADEGGYDLADRAVEEGSHARPLSARGSKFCSKHYIG